MTISTATHTSPRLNQVQIVNAAKELAESRIEQRRLSDPLALRLYCLAVQYGNSSGGQSTTDDLVQESAVVLLEHAAQFDGQTQAYITQACKWWAIQNKCHDGRRYKTSNIDMPYVVLQGDGDESTSEGEVNTVPFPYQGAHYTEYHCVLPSIIEDEDGEVCELLDFVADKNAVNPETALIEKEERETKQAFFSKVRAHLWGTNLTVFDALARGERPIQIAKRLGVGKSTVSNALTEIARISNQLKTQA